MLVELDHAEVEAVAAVMDSAILELSPEIVAADKWEHRAQLRDRRTVLQTALGKLPRDAVPDV